MHMEDWLVFCNLRRLVRYFSSDIHGWGIIFRELTVVGRQASLSDKHFWVFHLQKWTPMETNNLSSDQHTFSNSLICMQCYDRIIYRVVHVDSRCYDAWTEQDVGSLQVTKYRSTTAYRYYLRKSVLASLFTEARCGINYYVRLV